MRPFLFFTFFCLQFVVFSQDAPFNMSLIGSLDYQALHNANLNDCWGYQDETGIEYAIVGTTKGTSIVSLANPSIPTEVAWFPGVENVWRDIQTYNDFCYVVTEAEEGMLIIDLSPLPASTILPSYVRTFYGGSSPILTTHDIFIDTAGGWAYLCGSDALPEASWVCLDIHTDPINPVEVHASLGSYTHDGFTIGNYFYAANIYYGIFVYDVTDHSNPILVSQTLSPASLSHNLWTNSSNTVLAHTDEVIAAPITLYDCSNPANLIEIEQVFSNPGTNTIPHNTFILQDSLLATAYYTDGITLHNISRPHNAIKVGSFDTHELNTGVFKGAWGVYPFLESGLMLASDMQNGLFVIGLNHVSPGYFEGHVRDATSLLPINNAFVNVLTENESDFTSISGNFATGSANLGLKQVTISKLGYYNQTLNIDFQSGNLIIDTIDLIPIPVTAVTVRVFDAATSLPIINAPVSIVSSLDENQSVTDGFGEAQINLFYVDQITIHAGKWGFIEKCEQEFNVLPNAIFDLYLNTGYADGFELDLGWDASFIAFDFDYNGIWQRGVPANPEFTTVTDTDSDADCGNKMWLTGNDYSPAVEQHDVDNMETRLISPSMNLSNYTSPYVNYTSWFYSFWGPGLLDDTLFVEVKSALDEYVIIDKIGSTGNLITQRDTSILLTDFLTNLNDVQLRFRVGDVDSNYNITESGIDGFAISENPISLNSEKEHSKISIFPNPAINVLTILHKKNVKLIVFSAIGKTIHTQTCSEENTILDCSKWPSGVYFIQIDEHINRIIKE